VKSYFHDALSTNIPLIDSPFFESLLPSLNLEPPTEQLIREFARDGIVVLNEAVADDQRIEEIKRSFKGKYQPITNNGYHTTCRIQDAWKYNPAVRKVACSDSVMKLLSVIYRRTPIPFQTLNFEYGTAQPAHSDTMHFHCVPQGFMCGVWLALEDAHAANGPLFYYRGSHRLPYFDTQDLNLPSSFDCMSEYEDFIKALAQALKLEKVEVYLKKGESIKGIFVDKAS